MHWFAVYIAAIAINSIVLHDAGVDSIAYWASGACVIAAYIAGRGVEKDR